jgi:hypothetical protein
VRKKRIRLQRAKERKRYRQRYRRKRWLRQKNRLRNRKKFKLKTQKGQRKKTYKRRQEVIHLPSNFSFLNNPEEVLICFANFKRLAKDGTDVFFDFHSIQQISADVLPLLQANVFSERRNIRIAGNRPRDQKIDQLLLASGFYKMVGMTKEVSRFGLLTTHKRRVVDTEIAVKARILAATNTFNDPNRWIKPLYRTLIECMANTRKHASGPLMEETWWLSVYTDPVTKITAFSFFDRGVGIFNSTKLQSFTKLSHKLGLTDNRDILRKIVNGQIVSSTGLAYRGKGLPKIYSDYQANALKRLVIAANDTFADFDHGTFIELGPRLEGTFLYWEIRPD